MPRVKRGTVRRAKRKKLLGLAKGYYANKSKLYRAAKESVDTALKYAFVGRRILERLIEELSDVAIAETLPRLEGNQMHTILSRRPQSSGRAKATAGAAAKN
jgi:hypothetical protein